MFVRDVECNLNRLQQVVIVGCGRVGCQLGHLWRRAGLKVTGLVRSGTQAERLAASGLDVIRVDLDGDAALLPGCSLNGAALYYSAPPPDQGEEDTRLQRFLTALDTKNLPSVLVYLGTTGIYGQCHGGWVTEEHAPHPQNLRSKRRWHAETRLVAWHRRTGIPVVILRIAGIYGPGRLPLASLGRGQPVLNEADSPYSNRIHSDDLTTVCRRAAERARGLQVYNVSDGFPCKMATYYRLVAQRACLPEPPALSWSEAEARLSPGMLEFLRESRRIDNRKMLSELGVSLKYPTLALGLAHCGLSQ